MSAARQGGKVTDTDAFPCRTLHADLPFPMPQTPLPPPDCPLCPRLVVFRGENRGKFPLYQNAPVPSFGALDAALLIVGLAPGLHGANASGRPFTGDYAGAVLYPALLRHGFAQGNFHAEPGTPRVVDSLELRDCRITNGVRCVPPENKPTTDEIKTCNHFLAAEMAAMPRLRLVLSLGSIAHGAVLRARGLKPASFTFGHGAEHALPGLTLLNSYHTSRYNMNTRRLTEDMFEAIVARAAALLAA